jgi:hypothetical protein
MFLPLPLLAEETVLALPVVQKLGALMKTIS